MSVVWDAVVPFLASAAAIGVYAGNLLDVREWIRNGNTGTKSHIPYVFLCINAGGWLIYGLSAGNYAVIASNFTGLLISLIVSYYFSSLCASPHPQSMIHWSAASIYLVSLLILSLFLSNSAPIIGSLSSALAVAMFASPLVTLKTVLATKSADSLPKPMILAGLACSSLWTIYGLHVDDVFMYGPNSLAFLLGLAQLSLVILYANPKPILP